MHSFLLRGNFLAPGGVLADHLLEVSGRRIVRLFPASQFRLTHDVEHLPGGLLVPGFIDLQVNPVGRFDILTKGPDALPTLAIHLAKSGCTAFLLALITDETSRLKRAIAAAKPWVERSTGGAALLGLHLEGPFIHPARRGVHPAKYIQNATAKNSALLLKASGESLRMMTLAPEIPGGIALVRQLTRDRVVASIGHSDATYEQTMKSFDQGIRSATHLFNACSGLHQRAPGIVGAVLDAPGVVAQIIPDGVHVHPSTVRMAYRLKGKQSLCAVTDALVGGEKRFTFAGKKITAKSGKFLDSDGTLAGSSLSMREALVRLKSFIQAPLEDLIECLSSTPAALLGLRDKGSLEPGKDADMVWLNAQGEVLATWVEGEKVYVRDHRLHRK